MIVKDKALAAGSVATGLAAIIGASCCLLPLALAHLGIASALIAYLGIFVRAETYIMAAAAALIALGFLAAFWDGRRPKRSVVVLLIAATLLLAMSYVLPRIEVEILRWLQLR